MLTGSCSSKDNFEKMRASCEYGRQNVNIYHGETAHVVISLVYAGFWQSVQAIMRL